MDPDQPPKQLCDALDEAARTGAFGRAISLRITEPRTGAAAAVQLGVKLS